MRDSVDPDGTRLPIKLDSTSNGEFSPIPIDATNRRANALAHRYADEHSRRLGVGRREFLVSACGVASTLLAFNDANADAGRDGGAFQVDREAALDPEIAAGQLEGKEFIFDIQGHYVDPNGAWLAGVGEGSRPFSFAPKAGCALAAEDGERSYLRCLGPQEFIKDVFLDSDTDMMVLSFVPSTRESEPLTIEEADATRRIVDEMQGSQRLMLHGRVNPNQDGDLDAMDELAGRWKISAWKTYTQWGPDGRGFFLHDEEVGVPFIEKARKLGVRNICIHKGIPFGKRSYEHSQCSDIGVVAKAFPDVNFIVYHSGFVPGHQEGPYVAGEDHDGIDTLVDSVLANDIATNSNVYAELGSTWRFLMRDPDQAAHGLGKLLKYVGERNVLWGTDSIWYGSPQDQIQAFRSFQISERLREEHGYPEMTPQLRAAVFGLNATVPYGIGADEVALRARTDHIRRQRDDYHAVRDPSFATYGPRTRREFLNLLNRQGS